MALKEIKAYKCEYCGEIFPTDRNYHEMECRFNPKARTCSTCMFHRELIGAQGTKFKYCPRANQLFEYPHENYCPDYKPDPDCKE